jgi:hypothetical protein
MQVEEYIKYRETLLKDSEDDFGFISERSLIEQVMPLLLEAKLVDSEDFNESHFKVEEEKAKINGYLVNESGERLQVFIVNEDSLNLAAKEGELLISQRAYYDAHFARCQKFVSKAYKGYLKDKAQDSDGPILALIEQLASSEGTQQFDVVEIFLISATATVETRSETPQPKKFNFEDDVIKVSFQRDKERVPKEILVIKRLIDLNYLLTVVISQGNREALVIDFENSLKHPLEVIKAADEEHFESYLCVLPARVISDLYRLHSSRLLEKNVRSFLQFRGKKSVNNGIRETIRSAPAKFIAYNNGLTITATQKVIEETDGKLFIKSLTDFQIVNGGQTTASIYFTQKDGFDISRVKVMAKINVAKNVTEEEMDDLISKISKYSNSQSKVSDVDLRSRNPQLGKLKVLSDSIVTPSGLKWFFEKSKGEYNTLVRKAGKNKSRIEKEYPKTRRFTKEELGKYYTAWGDQPYMVKKGGEKVFRHFIEEISGEHKGKKELDINRLFYEELIAKIILFRGLEKIYGQGKYSKGQLRSVVVPYSLSAMYSYTTATDEIVFDLGKIWMSEEVKPDLTQFFDDLMTLMNELIKDYSESDDYGEYSKRQELWDAISESKELETFMSSKNATTIINKYCISKSEYQKRVVKAKKVVDLNFAHLVDAAEIFSNSKDYYKKIRSELQTELTPADNFKLDKIIESITNTGDLPPAHIAFEKTLTNRIRLTRPEIFDQIEVQRDNKYVDASKFIIKEYNSAIEQGIKVKTHFSVIRSLFEKKGHKFTAVFDTIGNSLESGNLPSMKEVALVGVIIK